MYERFRALSLLGQLITVVVALLAVSILLQIVVGIVKALVPLAFTALVILGLLWLFDHLRD
ncbi:MAG: hypothetical protein KJ047_10525 [Anaerolineae bacterium]|nr:hypothetical protein [Anaerolineae bacterium]MEB2287101.1 hypothetical protein [Anaerolineae bacterium]